MALKTIVSSALGAVALIAGFAVATDALAQSSDWQKVWAETVAAAKKEGVIACGCPVHPGSRAFLLSQWAKDYPDIKLEFTGAKLPEWPARVEAERAAGQFLWDAMFTGPGPEIYRLAGTGVLDPLLDHVILPDIKDPNTWGGWESAFYDKERKRMLSFWQDLTTPFFNAALVPPKEIEDNGLKVLLDPKYKGKIVWWDPRVGGSGSNAAMMIYLKLGEEGLRKVMVDQEPIFVRDATQIAERLVRGTSAISLGPSLDEPLAPFIKAGLKFDIRPFGNSENVAYASTSYAIASILNRPAHPNAAKVFINWLLSKPVQIGLGKAANGRSRRTDVPLPAQVTIPIKPGAKYINVQREEFLDQRQEVIKLATKFRPQ
jgi:iron(III) transport system substrate-binding protein